MTVPASEALERAVLRLELPPKSRVLVAVSGGPDSMALLDTFTALVRQGHAWELRVGHLNHALRGPESDADEQFVVAAAEARGIEVMVKRVDTAAHATRSKRSVEESARELRHEALSDMLDRWPGDVIAMGHTLDDQAETVLLRLLRGAGLSGLAAMRKRRGRIVRPFLDIPRSQILDALQEQGVEYRSDSSNADRRFLRNRLRAEAMPALRRVQGRADELLARTAALLADDAEYLQEQARRALSSLDVRASAEGYSASLPVWRSLHPALQGWTVRLLLGEALGEMRDVEAQHVVRARSTLLAGEPLSGSLPGGLDLWIEGDRFTLGRESGAEGGLETVELSVPGHAILAVGTLEASILENLDRNEIERLLAVSGPMHVLCDADALGGSLTVRSRRPGDRLHPLGLDGTRKLQDIMVDRHVPRGERDRIPVVTNAEHVVWVPGLALDGRVAISGETTRVAHLRFRLDGPDYRDTMIHSF